MKNKICLFPSKFLHQNCMSLYYKNSSFYDGPNCFPFWNPFHFFLFLTLLRGILFILSLIFFSLSLSLFLSTSLSIYIYIHTISHTYCFLVYYKQILTISLYLYFRPLFILIFFSICLLFNAMSLLEEWSGMGNKLKVNIYTYTW